MSKLSNLKKWPKSMEKLENGGRLGQDYFTNKVCSVGKSDRRHDVTQGNPLRLSEWGFKIGYFPNIYGDLCTLSCFSLVTEDRIFQ